MTATLAEPATSFGIGPGTAPLTVLRRPGVLPGGDDLDRVTAAACAVGRAGPESPLAPVSGPVLLLGRCAPTAAFSRRDTLAAGHPAAAAAAATLGFEPVIRPVGGHLAAYDEGSLVVHLWGPHPDPRRDLRARFDLAGRAIAAALTGLGVPDARVGAVPGEYCDGEWSVNSAGTAKLAGTGQRLFRHGFLFSAIVAVTRSEPVREVLERAYADLGLPLDPATIGCVTDSAPGVTVDEAREAVAAGLARLLSPIS